tara:strand:+ start:855 stop:1259 length:405 start_codon:yes stop_codon:yes gene_type:complete
MRKIIIFIVTLTAFTLCQEEMPFEIDLRTRIVNDSITLVNIQITNLIDKPLDYIEGFIQEINGEKEMINEKRMVLLYGYEPPLQTGFSTTRSISFPMVDIKSPNVYEFYISKLKFIGESRVFTWHQKTGFLRID